MAVDDGAEFAGNFSSTSLLGVRVGDAAFLSNARAIAARLSDSPADALRATPLEELLCYIGVVFCEIPSEFPRRTELNWTEYLN